MSIILDNRERDLMRLLSGVTEAVRPLDVGDAHICLSGGEHLVVIVERKAVADLESSLTDGRYREQRTRLLALCAESGAKPLYVIEGPLDRLGARRTVQELWKILNRLTMRYGISIMQTDDTVQTAEYLKTLAEQVAADGQCFNLAADGPKSYNAYVKVSKRGCKEDPRNFSTAVLMQCPGVSAAGAEALVNHYSGLTGVLGASVEDLASIVVGKRKLGKAVAERLHGLLHWTQCEVEVATADRT
jgi:ERCC4-type nuclease